MKRRWNLRVWAGFAIVLAAVFTYVPVFTRFPVTRDVPWATFLLFAVGMTLIAVGTRQALREPLIYRGRIFGPVLALLGAGLIAFFCTGVFYFARQLPASRGAPKVGEKAPDFALPDTNGAAVTLSALLGPGGNGPDASRAVLLVFYRGSW